MSLDQVSTLVFGTILVFFIFGGLFLFTRHVRGHFFPQDKSDKRESTLPEMQMLLAHMKSRDEGDLPGDDDEPPAPEGSDPPPPAREG